MESFLDGRLQGRRPHGLVPLDGFGRSYTVLNFGQDVSASHAINSALHAIGAPVQEQIIDDQRLRALYGFDLFLLRPDLHIAWRANAAPNYPAQLAAQVT